MLRSHKEYMAARCVSIMALCASTIEASIRFLAEAEVGPALESYSTADTPRTTPPRPVSTLRPASHGRLVRPGKRRRTKSCGGPGVSSKKPGRGDGAYLPC